MIHDGKETRQSHIHMRVRQSDKALIVRNLKDDEKLSEFMMKLAIAEAKKRQGRA